MVQGLGIQDLGLDSTEAFFVGLRVKGGPACKGP